MILLIIYYNTINMLENQVYYFVHEFDSCQTIESGYMSCDNDDEPSDVQNGFLTDEDDSVDGEWLVF